MRFAGPDVVLFIVGALLLSGSVFGLMQIGGLEGGDGAFAFEVDWSETTTEETVASFDGEDSVPFTFNVNETAVITVTVTVDCAHSPPLPDGVAVGIDVQVDGPGGSGEETGVCGSPVTVTIPVEEKPGSSLEVEAASERDAERQALQKHFEGVAVGEWSGTVTFDAPTGPLGGTAAPHQGDVEVALTKAVPKARALTVV